MSGESFIYFTGQCWVGLFSEQRDGKILRVGTYIFGPEPRASEIDAWLAKGAPGIRWEMIDPNGVHAEFDLPREKNPKRRLRDARREQERMPSESKALQAMRQAIELNKLEKRKERSRKTKELKARQFELKQKKKKMKHHGR